MQFLSVNEMHQLRCKNCHNFLSCGPMWVWREGTTLCGRCTSPKYKTAQAFTFEQVIKTIRVPCRYWIRHCKELLYPDEVPLHEQVCIYKNRCEMLCGDLSAVFKMEKSLPHYKEPHKLLNVPQQALEWLLCTKCSLYLSAPGTYINNQGRPFCYRCITPPTSQEYIRHVDLEVLLSFMVFPCIFHMRGCTKRYRFGDTASHSHEQECPYGFAAQRPISQMKTINVNGKQKGVIPTHTGHVFATITPNTIQLFANSGNWKDGQEKLMSNLQAKVGNKSDHEELPKSADQILDANKLEYQPRFNKNQTKPPPLNLTSTRLDIDETDNSILHVLKDSPKWKDTSENVPISPIFIQQQNNSSLPRCNSNVSTASSAIQKKISFVQQRSISESPLSNHNQLIRSDGSGNLLQRSVSSGNNGARMFDGEEVDEFQAYGLPYGNTNLTHGVQPNVHGKEVGAVERVSSGVSQYKNLLMELKIKQKIVECGDEG